VSILLVIALLLPVVFYMAAWIVTAGAAANDDAVPVARPRGPDILIALGLVAHAGALHQAVIGSGWRLGFAPILSATLLVGLALLWIEGFRVRLQALLRLVLPLAALASVLPLLFPGSSLGERAGAPLFIPHLISGTLAYGVLALAALQALAMAATERALHAGGASNTGLASRLVEQLPPLLVLERVLFRLITMGFVLLSLTVFSGVLFSEQVFGRPFVADHKTVFSVIAWLVFGLLLLGRRLWGWRGRTALRLTLGGFAILLLAYVGSRFVLEVILGRS
jgi:ABC-type uncharacterized transport system permease subunit